LILKPQFLKRGLTFWDQCTNWVINWQYYFSTTASNWNMMAHRLVQLSILAVLGLMRGIYF